jgi:ketosteroid isomerase-like protein
MDDARLHRMADKQEIEELLLRWCRGLDRGDEELLRATYHPDAVDEHGEVTYTGESAAGLYIEKHKRAFKRHMHITLNTLIELDGDRATAESYQLALLVPNDDGAESLMVAAGRYLDRLERRAGEWRFLHRHWIKESILKLDQVPNELWRGFIDAERGEQAPHGLPYSGSRSKDDLSYMYLRSTSSAP